MFYEKVVRYCEKEQISIMEFEKNAISEMERWGVGKMMVLSLHCIHFLRLNQQQEFRLNVGHQAELMGFCQTRMRQHREEMKRDGNSIYKN